MNEVLKTLIETTPSMNDTERGYWFKAHEHMDQQQIDRLFEILSNERKKLDELAVCEWEDNEVEAIIQVLNDVVNLKDLERL